jgi:hypothetical protein
MMYRLLFSLFMLLSLLSLAACQADSADPTPSPEPVAEEELVLILKPNALDPQTGDWILVAESPQVQETALNIVMTATYEHQVTGARAGLSITLYRNAADAPKVLQERLQTWEASPGQEITPYSTLADGAYLLNDTEAALALVDERGLVEVSFQEGRSPSDWELLALLQIGVEASREQDPPANDVAGTLGQRPLMTYTPEP